MIHPVSELPINWKVIECNLNADIPYCKANPEEIPDFVEMFSIPKPLAEYLRDAQQKLS
jgi:hypothetical protein